MSAEVVEPLTDETAPAEPCEGDRMPPLERAQREAAMWKRDNEHLRRAMERAITDLDCDRPRDHISAELAGALECF